MSCQRISVLSSSNSSYVNSLDFHQRLIQWITRICIFILWTYEEQSNIFRSRVGGSQDFSHGNYLDELAADIRCYLIEIVTMWTVLTVTSVDLEELKQLAHLEFWKIWRAVQHAWNPRGWKSIRFHIVFLDEVTADIRCRLIQRFTSWTVSTFTKVE